MGIPDKGEAITTNAGGWFHLENAFETDRFERTVRKEGVLSFSVGMPNYAAIYSVNAALGDVESVGVAAIAAHANPLVAQLEAGLRELSQPPMCPQREDNYSGILAIQHARADVVTDRPHLDFGQSGKLAAIVDHRALLAGTGQHIPALLALAQQGETS